MDKVELAKLRSDIDRAAQLYYTPGCESPVTDDQFEAMMGQLRAVCPEDYRLTRVGTPFVSDNMREKRPHSIPMGSLDNTDQGILGFAPWYDRTCELLGVESFTVNASYKMDGNSIALKYADGELVEALSRGDGEIGELLTANAVKWLDVPTCLQVPFTGTVRGEAILYKAEFDNLKEQDPSLSNPRNVGSGILGRIDGTQNELIRFVAFNIIDQKTGFSSLTAKFKVLRALGFNPVQHLTFKGTRDEVVKSFTDYFAEMETRRPALPFEIDGIVVMVDGVEQQKSITKDRKDELRPKYGRAVKFVTAKATTRVTGVNITVGHTGAIFPTITVEPVYVGGVTVSNVAMNNWNEHSEFPSAADVAIGDLVEIARQGDVIPKVVAVIEKPEDRQPILEPTTCPACGSPTTRVLRGKAGAVTYCVNANNCTGASGYKIKHFIRDAEIMGVGDGVLRILLDSDLVKTPADLYRLTAEQLVNLKIGESKSGTAIRLGESRTAALLAEIAKAKTLPITRFLGALGVPLLGKRRVEIIAREQGLRTLDDWCDTEKVMLIPGDVMRTTIVEGLNRAWPLIDELLEVGVEVQPYVGAVNEGLAEINEVVVDAIPGQKTIKGSSFCFTGTRDCLDEVTAAGGIIKSGVSKGLDYLVQKDPTSSSNKTLKAESLGVKIIGIECLKQVLAGERELP